MAERQGFEPWVSCPTTVFKTVPFNRSGISPYKKWGHCIKKIFDVKKFFKKINWKKQEYIYVVNNKTDFLI